MPEPVLPRGDSALPTPENVCGRCGGPNVVWVAPSPLWNAVMRGGSIEGVEDYHGIVCPTCFAVLAETSGVASHWELHARDVAVELETVTPSGRTWDADRMMWVTSTPSAPKRPPAGIAWPVKLDDYACRGTDADGAVVVFDDLLFEGNQVADYRDEDGNHYGPMHAVERREDGLWVV